MKRAKIAFVLELTREEAVSLSLLAKGGFSTDRGHYHGQVQRALHAISSALDEVDDSLDEEQFNIWQTDVG